MIRIGTAGWTIPRAIADGFPSAGSHLQRYAARLGAAEINSSFYRPHRPQTYAKWAASVPTGFRFSVKMPKQITHELRLASAGPPLGAFLEEIAGLGAQLGCLLVQLPPSLACELSTAAAFFALVRSRYPGPVVVEPRHESWCARDVERLLIEYDVGRVAADPARIGCADAPAGSQRLLYYRLHGSPRTYYSAYSQEYLADLARRLAVEQARGREVWCIFDNTASGSAAENALQLEFLMHEPLKLASSARLTRNQPNHEEMVMAKKKAATKSAPKKAAKKSGGTKGAATKAATKKAAPKKSAAKKGPKRSAAKRELIAPRGDKRYIRRDELGRIKESDDVGRSLSQDRRRTSKNAARPGQGDKGDRKPAGGRKK